MFPPAESLLKYDSPVLISNSTDGKSPRSRSASPDATRQKNEAILNTILPPRKWMQENQLWMQKVSTTPTSRTDIMHLENLLNTKLHQRQAMETGICPIRRELYSQCFDELIRQVTINCAERGLMLLRVRDEIQMTIAAYQALYDSSVAFGMRKALQIEQSKADLEKRNSDLENETVDLKKQLNEQKAKCEAIEERENEQRHLQEKLLQEEIQYLKRANQQLKTQMEGLIVPK
uniref:axonemal dynein light intermediate polypeptide 1 isoform X2 n=1 Tax=Monopterus albus TaxID=43700 RepID=UPI0009B3F09F|nr:axonemal dynein light intermediate polypeptide 1 isoform X2 [Monopterus albus]